MQGVFLATPLVGVSESGLCLGLVTSQHKPRGGLKTPFSAEVKTAKCKYFLELSFTRWTLFSLSLDSCNAYL